MKHEFNQKVFYSDTDAYSVVWHGSYLRWMEMGRIGLCEIAGFTMTDLFNQDILIPVAEVNIRYKSPAIIEENLIVQTELEEYSRLSLTFSQIIMNAETKKVHIIGKVKVVATHKDGTLYKDLPEKLLNFAKQVM